MTPRLFALDHNFSAPIVWSEFKLAPEVLAGDPLADEGT
jgi:hypothetical protein